MKFKKFWISLRGGVVLGHVKVWEWCFINTVSTYFVDVGASEKEKKTNKLLVTGYLLSFYVYR